MQFGAVLSREGHVGENVVLAVVHEHAELGPPRPELVGDVAPGLMRDRGIGLQNGLADRGSNRRVLALRDMRQGGCASNAPDTFAMWRLAHGRWRDAGRRARPRSPARRS
jgi:hypothetical protein